MSVKGIIGGGIILVTVVMAIVIGYATRDKTTVTAVAKTSIAPPPPPQTVEALVPEHECLTPCTAFVGWQYKVRTDGDPLRIKYHDCADWFDQPAKGQFDAPKCFRPGEAEFESSDKTNPHVQVWVYERTNIRR